MAIIELENGVRLEVADGLSDADIDEIVDDYEATTSANMGVIDTFKAYSDAASTVLSNVGGTIAGSTYGLAKGLYNAVEEGTYGTQEGVRTVRNTMADVTDQFSKGEASTPEGRSLINAGADIIQDIAEPIMEFDQEARILEPLAMLPASPPLIPLGASAGAGVVARNAATAPYRKARDLVSESGEPPVSPRSVGSSETSKAVQRQDTATDLPSPFEGDSQLTRGQLTRDNDQLRFERETAKMDGVGAPITQRYNSQQENMHTNFNLLGAQIDGPIFGDDIAQGSAVRRALDEYRTERKKEKDAAYQRARDAGETNAPVQVEGLGETFEQMWIDRGIVPKNEAMFREANRLSIIDEQGNLKPTSVDTLETFRKFVNRGYNLTDPTEARQRRILINSIDNTLDNTDAGPAYKEARAIASAYYDEFDNSPLASGIASNRRGTNVQKIADEKVASKVISSSVQEIEQLKSTLSATERGMDQWRGIQGAMLESIRKKAFGTQTDTNGTPLLKPAEFKKHVQALDQSGKLEAVLGKEVAQNLRNMVEVSDAIGTTPPGVVNHSGTSAMLMNHLMGMANPRNMIIKGIYDHVQTGRKVDRSLDGMSLFDEGMQ